MNPEPLKGKVYSDGNKKFYCKREEVKSAVEWLKQEDEKDYKLYKNKQISFDYLVIRLKFNRFKAFEDVVKK